MLTHFKKRRPAPKATKASGLQAARDRGATAVEYGLIIALIAAVIAATVAALGGSLNGLFKSVDDCVKSPTTSGSCDVGTGSGG